MPPTSSARTSPSANAVDCLIVNGQALTQDAKRPRAEAVALSGDRIVAVGSTGEMRALARGAVREIDAAGGTITPGLIDAHVHLFAASAELDFVDVHSVSSIDGLARAVKPYAAERPEEPVVMAVFANYDFLGPGVSPDRHALDKVISDRPFAVFASDHHTLWANTAALELCDLLHGAELAPGNEVEMGADGLATGVLKEPDAYGPVLARHKYGGRDLLGMVTGKDPETPPTAAERERDKAALRIGLAHCIEHGITGLHNMDGNFYTCELLAELEAAGELPLRIQVPMHLKNTDSLDRLEEAAEMHRRFASDRLWSGRVKMFVDGVLDSHTAFCLEPYPANPDTSGLPLFEQAHFDEVCRRVDAMGLQISTHAIGDAAVRRTLDGYAAAQAANGVRDSRHRVEHIEVIHPDDVPRFRELGVVASMQPLHLPFGSYFTPGEYEVGKLLLERHRGHFFPWRTLREAGAMLCFSTDWPIVPLDPMASFQAALEGGAPAGWPDQRQSFAETLEAFTRNNAWLEFKERDKGQLKPGMLADITVYDKDLEATPPNELPGIKPIATISGGRVVHSA